MRHNNEPTTAKPPHKRRWLNISLRSLIVIWSLVAVWLAIQVNRARTQAQAVRELGEVGNIVYAHELVPSAGGGNRYDIGAEAPGPRWLRHQVGDDFFREVERIAISPTDRHMTMVSELPQVQGIAIAAYKLTDAGVRKLAHLTKLKRLQLHHGHGLTDDAFTFLGRLHNLEYVDIRTTPVGDRTLSYLEACSTLKQVVISNTLVTQGGIEKLKNALPNARVQAFQIEQYGKDPNSPNGFRMIYGYPTNDAMRFAK